MNTKNNKRKRESIEKIEKAFINLLQKKEINQISVTDICKDAGFNRSTFYANYLDIYDLADKLREKLENDFALKFNNKENRTSLKMFEHIYENQIFYKTYFKLGYHEKIKISVYDDDLAKRYFNGDNLQYHMEFFRNGLTAIIKMWLFGGCKETPEEMNNIFISEYKGR